MIENLQGRVEKLGMVSPRTMAYPAEKNHPEKILVEVVPSFVTTHPAMLITH